MVALNDSNNEMIDFDMVLKPAAVAIDVTVHISIDLSYSHNYNF